MASKSSEPVVARLPRILAWIMVGRVGVGGSNRADGPSLPLIAPALLLVTAFVVLPIAYSIYLSFKMPTGFGLDAYVNFFGHGQYELALRNTIVFSAVSAIASVTIAFPACLYVSTKKGLVFQLFLGALGVSLAISGLIRTVSWQLLLSRSGMIDTTSHFLGITKEPIDILYSKTAVLVGMTQIMMPIAAMSLLNGMRSVDQELMRVAGSFGASPLRIARDVYWPQMRKPVSNALLMVFTLATGLFLIPALLGGPSDTVLGKLILSDMAFDFETGAARASVSGVAAMTMVLIVTLLCLAIGGRPYHRRSRK